MGGAVKSAGGFLGLGKGPQAPGVQSGNESLNALNAANTAYTNDSISGALNNYAQGNMSSNDVLNTQGITAGQRSGMDNALATGATTGSKYATEQVQNNPLMSQGLNAMSDQLKTGQGLQSSQTGILNGLQSQGFELKPEDQTLYGQESGNIARQFGQQGNQAANSLASRGLSSSGAAGATFSGLAGNQNEMLSQAQQQIAQTRFQNTMSQIGQQQSFINSLNSQNNQAAGNYANTGASMVNQQYGRQLAGAQNQTGDLSKAAGLQTEANSATNQGNMTAANFNQANTPVNFMDYAAAGAGQSMFNATSGKNVKQGMSAATGMPNLGGSANSNGGSGMMG